ncbi:hypothetical protein LSH36_483g02008, partial [Paralvinella palmiformis]
NEDHRQYGRRDTLTRYPDTHGIKQLRAMVCWTCPKRPDNESCNRWAPNRQCPTGYTMCQTIHKINTLTGMTLLVHKRCALPSECSMEMVGCHSTNIPGIQDCISCCNYAYCNEHAASNQTAVVQYSILASSGSPAQTNLTSTNTMIHISVKIVSCAIWYIASYLFFAEGR